MNRRSFLRAGSLVFGGSLLADLLRLEATGQSTAAEKRSVIIVFQAGGPSHLETWDMKPQAPVEYRGEFKSIATNLPGYRIGEYTPRLAKLCDRLAILRSVYHDQTEHGQACHLYMTGYRPTKNDPGNEFPSCGSIISRELGPRRARCLPTSPPCGHVQRQRQLPRDRSQPISDLRLSDKSLVSRSQSAVA